MMHFSLMILMAQQVFYSHLSQIIESMPACVVAVCKHLRLESVCEYCALNSFASSLILLNLRYVVSSCVLNIILVYIQHTKELFISNYYE